jgi:hypothetical protein
MRDVVRQATTFPELLRRLEARVVAETGSSLTDATRSELERRVRHAIMVYRGTKFVGERASRSTLHEIANPLARVISLLEHEPNRDSVLGALGAPEMRGRFSVDDTGTPAPPIPTGDEQQVAARYGALLDGLRSISRAVPASPAKRKRGKPPTARSFRDFIERLATCWERASGTPFRSVNRSKQFVIYVVEFVDPTCLEKLPYVIEHVVADRRAQISEK